jgi:hypothetical protein
VKKKEIALRFNEIQTLRGMGEGWKAIASRLFGEVDDSQVATLRMLYSEEVKKRSNPDLLAASDWVKAHRKEITKMLRSGTSWIQIGHTLGSPIPLTTS